MNDKRRIRILRYIPSILLGVISLIIIARFLGVTIFDSLKYVGYSLLYVLLPGWCFYRILSVNPGSRLRQFCLGWVLGYVLEAVAYLIIPATPQLHGINYVALIVLGVCFPLLYSKLKNFDSKSSIEQISSREILFYICISVLVVITVSFYGLAQIPLPSHPGGVTYYQDLVYYLGYAAEAKWHSLPFQNPSVAGEPLCYYHFSYIHMAMASRITGIELSTILFRLFPLELYFLWAIMLCWAGKELIGSWKSGVILTSLVLLVGSLSGPFVIWSSLKVGTWPLYLRDLFFNLIYEAPVNSPNFLFGTTFFICLMVLINGYLKKEDSSDIPSMVIICILIISSAFIKSVLTPIFIMGLFGFLIWEFIIRRKVSKVPFIAFVIACIAYIYSKNYTQASYVNYIRINPFYPIRNAEINGVVMYYINKFIPNLSWLAKITLPPFVVFGYAPLIMFGLILFFYYKKCRLTLSEIWLLSLFLVPYLVVMTFSFTGGDWNFLVYGTIPLGVLSAKGLVLLFTNKSRGFRPSFVKGFTVLLLCLGLLITFVKCLFPTINSQYYVRRYGNKSLLTDDLLSGLRWLRSNTNQNAVIAVNYNQELWKEKNNWAYSEIFEKERYWYYSAFSERRIFLEGVFFTPQFWQWINVYKESPEHIPFSERKTLLNRFLKNKDKNALIEMRDRFNVSYLLNDKRREANEWLKIFDNSLIRLVYSNEDADIYKILNKYENSPH